MVLWYDSIAVTIQEQIREIPWDEVLGPGREYEVTSRAKTLDTLREKLERRRDTPLSNIQDIAGVRFEAEMTLEEQDRAVQAIATRIGCADDPSSIHDLRNDPHSGYRAVHIWGRLPAGHVEVQVRTHLQGRWANAYEAIADVLGRGIRYGEIPQNEASARVVRKVQELAVEQGAVLEVLRVSVARLNRAPDSLFDQLAEEGDGPDLDDGVMETLGLAQGATPREVRDAMARVSREMEERYAASLTEIEKVCRSDLGNVEGGSRE